MTTAAKTLRPVTYHGPDHLGQGGYLLNEAGDLEARGFATCAEAERWAESAGLRVVPAPWRWGADAFPTRNTLLEAAAMLLQERLAENDPPLGTVEGPDGRRFRVVVGLTLYPVRA